MSYQIILFDLDDTLIDFAHSERVGLRDIFEKYYFKIVDYSTFQLNYKAINAHLWKQVGSKESSLMPNDVGLLRFFLLNQKLSCPISAEQIANEYDKNLYEHVYWIANVSTAIQFLHQKGHILGIITNGSSDVQTKKYFRLQLERWFDCCIISESVGIAKPNTEIFEIALHNIAIKRNHTIHSFVKNSILMVGDSIISDGYGAKNFGIDFCFINNQSIDLSATELPITYNIKTVASLPFCLGYEAEYNHFLNTYPVADPII